MDLLRRDELDGTVHFHRAHVPAPLVVELCEAPEILRQQTQELCLLARFVGAYFRRRYYDSAAQTSLRKFPTTHQSRSLMYKKAHGAEIPPFATTAGQPTFVASL